MAAEQDALSILIIEAVQKALERRVGDVIRGGQLRLRGVPISGGPLGTGGGGTGTTTGFKDHSHAGGDNGQKLAEVNTHQSLDVLDATRIHWTKESLQDMLAAMLVAGSGIDLTYNDVAGTLEVAQGASTTGGYGQFPYGGPYYGSTPTGIVVADEGILVEPAGIVNFIGAGVAAYYDPVAKRVNVSIPGGGGGGGSAVSFVGQYKWGVD